MRYPSIPYQKSNNNIITGQGESYTSWQAGGWSYPAEGCFGLVEGSRFLGGRTDQYQRHLADAVPSGDAAGSGCSWWCERCAWLIDFIDDIDVYEPLGVGHSWSEPSEMLHAGCSNWPQVYSLMGKRLQEQCRTLQISHEIRQKIWTCFDHSLVHFTDLVVDRHLDQLMLCAINIMTKVSWALLLVCRVTA